MFSLRNTFIYALLLFLFAFTPTAQAMLPGALPVNWPQDNISWNQLQTLMGNNPGYNQFNIRFPNGTVWNTEINTLQALYQAYNQHAQVLGYGNNAPALVFSSLNKASRQPGGGMTIPLGSITQNAQNAMQNLMTQMDYERYHLASYLPDWLKDVIVMICNGLVILCDSILELLQQWFG